MPRSGEDVCTICLESTDVFVFTCNESRRCRNAVCRGCLQDWIRYGSKCTICNNGPKSNWPPGVVIFMTIAVLLCVLITKFAYWAYLLVRFVVQLVGFVVIVSLIACIPALHKLDYETVAPIVHRAYREIVAHCE